MTIAQSLLPEFDQELATTRALLALVPEERAAWKPHERSFSLGDLAMHIANIPTWGASALAQTELDMQPVGGPAWAPRAYESLSATLARFDENAATARAALAAASDEDLMVGWTLKNAGQTVFTMPRAAVLRSFVLNHIVHHRGQLSVYLRLCDVPLPSIYGPTADAPM